MIQRIYQWKYFFETLLLGILLLCLLKFSWLDENWQANVLSSDGHGYYAYLPAVFIHQDFTYQKNTFDTQKELGIGSGNLYIKKTDEGKVFNKFYLGVAVLQAPFFGMASLTAWITGFELNGYSKPYLLFFQLGGVFYALLGFYYLRKTFRKLNLHTTRGGVVLLVLFLSTPLVYYSTFKCSLSHIYSFGLISMWVNWWIEYKDGKDSHFFRIVLLSSLIVLVRPIHIILIFSLPFLIGTDKLIEFLRSLFTKHLLSLLLGMSILLLLPILWYLQTGCFWLWNYQGEGFDFFHPRLLDVWFSYRNGLFVWTPILPIGLVVFFLQKNISNSRKGWFVFFFLMVSWVISSWWNWYYGGGFSHRAFVDYLPISFLAIGIGFELTKKKLLLILLAFGCVSLNFFQTYQVTKDILPTEYMNASIYWDSWFRYEDEDRNRYGGSLDIRPKGKVVWSDSLHFDEVLVDQNHEYGLNAHFQPIPEYSDAWMYVEFEAEKKMLSEDLTEFLLVIEGKSNGETIDYLAKPLYYIVDQPTENWEHFYLAHHPWTTNWDECSVYIWNMGRKSARLKSIEVRFSIIQYNSTQRR